MKQPVIEYTKDLVEQYNFKSSTGDHAKIIIELKERTLYINISSSFGTWSYRWRNCSPQLSVNAEIHASITI